MAVPWRVGTILVVALALLGGPAAAARDSSDEEPSGSLAEQVTGAAVRSLGAAAPVAILRAEDRGYDVLQLVEAILEERLAVDGTITDEDGAVIVPFRDPSGLIEGDPAGSGEAIGIALLERGIDKVTTRLDRKVDLERRAERAGVPDESLFTGLAAIGLLADGYSPQQIIEDGLIGRGITLKSPVDGPVIVDERGKVLRPAGIEESPEQQESAAAIDSFVADVVDLIGGVDPTTAATTPFDAQFQVAIEIEITDVDGASYTIVGDGKLGVPDDKGLRTFVVGRGGGDLVGAGACSLGGGEQHPFEIEGNINLGLSGPATDGIGNVRVAVTEANLGVVGDDSLCVDIVREITPIFELITYGPVEVRLRDGATGSAVSPFADATAKTTLKLST